MVKYDNSYNSPNPTSFTARYADVTLHVPAHLVNSYKLDPEWYKYKEIVGFDCDDVTDWTLKDDLTLTPRDRFKNTPSVYIDMNGSLKINGTDPMPLNNLVVEAYPDENMYGRIFSNADGVTVGGELCTHQYLGLKNNWYFLSLPYDVKVADITNRNNNPKFAVRYYDGANRAANGASGSWKNYSADDIIPAGTGFIFQASEAAEWKFPSQDNANKQNMTSNRMFVKVLAENPSESASDRGWNLVGNPYQSWYNIHKLNFTAPITVREKNSYAAYSVIDDDYALAPNQAFFVQCPEGISSISFPMNGRQMTSVITSQSGIKAKDGYAAADGRRRVLTDITLSDGANTDRTRVVINAAAANGYEPSCDASKFMSDDAGVPQLYTVDNAGVRYAINERPEGNGVVRLGFRAGEGGCFTFSLTRNMAAKVVLVDNEKGLTVDLMSQDYQFTADAGTNDSRFELRLAADGSATGVDGVQTGAGNGVSVVDGGIVVRGARGGVAVYTAGGAKVAAAKPEGGEARIRLAAGNYVVKTAGGAFNVVVK